ncbi:MAG: metallophosphoesterase [Verrucomicrobiae bacterium]|nr:metallophosphoesterase [Verrucomicrobiae bacterium]
MDSNTWALLADLHIAAKRTKAARGVVMADNLTAVVRDLTALPTLPSAVLIAGDCSFGEGEADDYATLGDLLQPLRSAGMTLHFMTGNHDNRDNLRAAFGIRAGEGTKFGRHVAVVQTPLANWFLLDSLDPKIAVAGRLGDAQRAWLAAALDAHAQKPAILVAHHYLDDGVGKQPLQDTKEFLEIIVSRKQVKAFIYGHSHDWKVSRHASGIHLINLPPVGYVFSAGKPAGWVLATMQADGIRLQLKCVDRNHPMHGQVVPLEWRRE